MTTIPCEMRSGLFEQWQNTINLTNEEVEQMYKEYNQRYKTRRCCFDDCQNTVRLTKEEQENIDYNLDEYEAHAQCNLCEHHYEIVSQHKIFTRENINKYIDTHAELKDVNKETSLYDSVLQIFAARRYESNSGSWTDAKEKIFNHRHGCGQFRVVSFNDLMYQMFSKDRYIFNDLKHFELELISVLTNGDRCIFFHIPTVENKLDIFFNYWRKITLYFCEEIPYFPKSTPPKEIDWEQWCHNNMMQMAIQDDDDDY